MSIEEIIYSHAVGINSDNSAIRQWSGLQEHRKHFAELRATLGQEAARDIRIMQLPDGPSSDRHAWAAAAGEHGREVYRDDDNNADIQQQRLIRLQHLAQREIDAGWQPPVVKFQPGSDDVVVEMVRAQLVRLGGWEIKRPDAWCEVERFQRNLTRWLSFNEIHQSVDCDSEVLHPCLPNRYQTREKAT